MAPCDTYRRLTLFLSCTVLISNLGAIHLYRHLPDDPHHLTWHLSTYSYFASVLAVLGFVGARKSHATFVAIFSNFLLIDTVICTIPRLVVITLFPSIRDDVCSTDTIHAWLESQTASSAIAADGVMRAQMVDRCRTVVGVLQTLTALFAIAFTVIQIVLALRVSSYAVLLCRQEDDLEERKVESKKAPIAYEGLEGKSVDYKA